MGIVDDLSRQLRESTQQLLPKPGSTGLALGGGAVHGAAHIGVLRALEEHGIEPGAISGTSIGAMIAALKAFGVSVVDMDKAARQMKWMDISRVRWKGLGLLGNDGIHEVLKRFIKPGTRIEDAPIPLFLVTVDIASGEKLVLKEGDLFNAVAASTAIPGIFNPVELDGRYLVDGGLLENVPVSPLRAAGVSRVIAVDLSARDAITKPENILDVITNAVSISIRSTTEHQLQNADLIIEPELAGISAVDVDGIPGLINLGYAAARYALRDYLPKAPG